MAETLCSPQQFRPEHLPARRRKNLILSLPPNMRTLVTPTYEFLVYIRQTTAVTTTVNHPARARG